MLLLVPEPVCPLLTDPLRLSLRAAKRRDGTSARCHPSTAPAAGSLSAAGTAEQAEPAAGHGDTRSHCAAEELSSKLLVLPGFLVPGSSPAAGPGVPSDVLRSTGGGQRQCHLTQVTQR